jgi:hypothetical protein
MSLNGDWTHLESYHSKFGSVQKVLGGEWKGLVNVGGKFARLSELYISAEVAMGAVERTWKREEQKRNAQK